MNEPQKSDSFLGDWTPQSFAESLSLSRDDQGEFAVTVGERTYGPLAWDADWKNLAGEDACLSLHGKSGRLFGIYLDAEGLQTVAAVRGGQSVVLEGPACGEDAKIFERMVDRAFTLRILRDDDDVAPAAVGEQVAIHRRGADYLIGKIAGKTFEPFDRLCPDGENGNLNSRDFKLNQPMRSVTLWEQPGRPSRLFSMVAVPREALETARDAAGADRAFLARGLGLLPFELEALLARQATAGPGDPLIVWGADDGGG